MEREFTSHAREMLNERGISEGWVLETLESPGWREPGNDGNVHYFKAIAEREGRVLHVVVNPGSRPEKIVTVFFDRKAQRKT